MNRIANADNINGLLAQTECLLAVQHSSTERQSPTSKPNARFNGERLDVAWRRVVASIPQKVFEVQVSSNLYSAIGKSKKAHLFGNSQPFPVLIYVLDVRAEGVEPSQAF